MNHKLKNWIEFAVYLLMLGVAASLAVKGIQAWPDTSAFVYFAVALLFNWYWVPRLSDTWRRL